MDLILADIPEGLPVPGISNPSTAIPTWNQETHEWLQPIFDFADNHVHDDGAIILFHPFRMTTKAMILGYCECFGFQVRKEWWGMNRLHLTSPINQSVTVSYLSISITICFLTILKHCVTCMLHNDFLVILVHFFQLTSSLI